MELTAPVTRDGTVTGRQLASVSIVEPQAMRDESHASKLGLPMKIGEVATMIGCSGWTVRQTLMPRGLPHFRLQAHGRLIFYREQVIRWIEQQQTNGSSTRAILSARSIVGSATRRT